MDEPTPYYITGSEQGVNKTEPSKSIRIWLLLGPNSQNMKDFKKIQEKYWTLRKRKGYF